MTEQYISNVTIFYHTAHLKPAEVMTLKVRPTKKIRNILPSIILPVSRKQDMGEKTHLSSLHLHELLKRKNILVYN